MNKYIPLKEKDIKIHGRTSSAFPLTLFWTGSGIEFITDAAEVYIELESGFSVCEQWIRIEVNGHSSIRTPLASGMTELCVFRGMEKRTEKRIRLIKEAQPMGADPNSYLRIHTVKADGKLVPFPDKPFLIEFIGDSITSGEGLGGDPSINEFVPSIFSTEGHYAFETAKAVNADLRIISQSGWGVYSSWDNDLTHTLPKIYPYVCGAQIGGIAARLGSRDLHRFIDRVPDIIVVNLGTNDSFAFDSPAWTDPQTGTTYKQRKKADGSLDPDDTEKIAAAVRAFLKQLRNIYKDTYIIWAYGMIGRSLETCIRDAVTEYAAYTNDSRILFTLLPDTRPDQIAANNHPGKSAHAESAKTLVKVIKSII